MKEQVISIDEVLKRLHLSAMPLTQAYGRLEELLAEPGGMSLYFDGSLEPVTDADHECEPIYSTNLGEENVLVDLLIANGVVSSISGQIQLCSPHFIKRNGRYEIITSKFVCSGKEYYSCDEAGMVVQHLGFDLDSVYVLEADLQQLVKADKPMGGEPGLRKALALLAQEKAQSCSKFRTGDKVNASAFKDHVIQLADKYGLTSGYLKTLDDKLNSILDGLELKEVHQLDQRDK